MRVIKLSCVDSQSQCFGSNHRNSARDVEWFTGVLFHVPTI